MQAEANAKVNLALRVGRLQPGGLHKLDSLMLSISWSDTVAMERASEDAFEVTGHAPTGSDNLVVAAVAAMREDCRVSMPVHISLTKRIPMAAGLGGGSADAAAALVLASGLWACAGDAVERLAPSLGSDVPFCAVGGLARVAGTGEIVEPLPGPGSDFALAVVVPPAELSTARIYAEWERLGGPRGRTVTSGLPPSLREFAPLANDLEPAAVAVAPTVADWLDDLTRRWGRPVLLSGSGPSLFSFFVDADEAGAAIDDIPPGARHARAVVPEARGVSPGGGTLP